MCICMIFNFSSVLAEDADTELTEKEIIEAVSTGSVKNIRAKSAMVYDRKYHQILYEKNIDEELPNASTTKILTAIVAYENANMNDLVSVSAEAARIGGSTIGLRMGNKVLLGDLLKGLLICSGNDAAIAIAEHVGGSVENFANMMNQKALELGAYHTSFVTPHGLDNDEHYTTARDLITFADYLLQIPYLSEIVATRFTTIKIDENIRELRTTNEMLSIYSNAKGVKTGYTGKAGRCLVTAVESGDREIITVVLGCETKKQRTSESIWLIQHGFQSFEEVDLYEKMKHSFEILVEKAAQKEHVIEVYDKKMVLLPVHEKEKITYEYHLLNHLVAPLKKEENVGEAIVKINGVVFDTFPIKISYEIPRKTVLDYLKEMMKHQIVYTQIRV